MEPFIGGVESRSGQTKSYLFLVDSAFAIKGCEASTQLPRLGSLLWLCGGVAVPTHEKETCSMGQRELSTVPLCQINVILL